MNDQKVALITGAGRGIGAAIAHRLSREGFAIAVNDVNAAAAQAVAQEITTKGARAVAVPADVTSQSAVQQMVHSAVAQLGRLDVLVNNAGIVQIKPILELIPDDIEKVYRVNVFAMFYCIQAAAAQMIKQGHGGKIINASSVAGQEGYAFSSVYGSGKFAVRGLTQSAARELAKHGITVNAYCPGVVDTDMWTTLDREMARYTGAKVGDSREMFLKMIALGRIQTVDDVAGFVAFLASADADYMTGQSTIIDGGLVMR